MAWPSNSLHTICALNSSQPVLDPGWWWMVPAWCVWVLNYLGVTEIRFDRLIQCWFPFPSCFVLCYELNWATWHRSASSPCTTYDSTTSNGEANQTCQHFAKSFQTSFLFLAFGRKLRFATDRHSHSANPLKSIYESPPWSSIFSATMPSEKTKCWKMLGSDPRSVAIVANLRVPVTFQHLPTVLVSNPMPNSCMTLEAIRWIWESSKSLVARLSSSSKKII